MDAECGASGRSTDGEGLYAINSGKGACFENRRCVVYPEQRRNHLASGRTMLDEAAMPSLFRTSRY